MAAAPRNVWQAVEKQEIWVVIQKQGPNSNQTRFPVQFELL